MAGEFCVVCGRTDRPLVDGECADCYANRVPLVRAPERPVVVLCPTCGSRRVGQHWEPGESASHLTAADLTPLLEPHPEAALRRVRWTETGGHALQRELEGQVDLRFRHTERTLPVHLIVRIEHRTCPDCSRRSGRFYTALIQLRAAEDGPPESARERRDRLDRWWAAGLAEARPTWKEALSWREALPEGWDFYLTDTVSARALARYLKGRLGADLKESATLYGRKDGRDLYRVTICLRVPPGEMPPSAGERGRPPVERHA